MVNAVTAIRVARGSGSPLCEPDPHRGRQLMRPERERETPSNETSAEATCQVSPRMTEEPLCFISTIGVVCACVSSMDGVHAMGMATQVPLDDGRAAGFETLYRAEYRGLLALAVTLTVTPAAAEELVQETFLRVYARWNRIAGYERPGAFARRVLLNLATSRARRLAAEARAMTRLGNQTRSHHVDLLTPEALGFSAAVRSLSRRQAQVVLLRYIEDRSVADIASILGCSEVTVRSHLHTGRKRLAELLQVADREENDDSG